MTVTVLFRRSEISASLLPSNVSFIKSMLSRRQASMRISPTEAPWFSSVTAPTAQPKTDDSSNLVLLLISHIGLCWVVKKNVVGRGGCS